MPEFDRLSSYEMLL